MRNLNKILSYRLQKVTIAGWYKYFLKRNHTNFEDILTYI